MEPCYYLNQDIWSDLAVNFLDIKSYFQLSRVSHSFYALLMDNQNLSYKASDLTPTAMKVINILFFKKFFISLNLDKLVNFNFKNISRKELRELINNYKDLSKERLKDVALKIDEAHLLRSIQIYRDVWLEKWEKKEHPSQQIEQSKVNSKLFDSQSSYGHLLDFGSEGLRFHLMAKHDTVTFLEKSINLYKSSLLNPGENWPEEIDKQEKLCHRFFDSKANRVLSGEAETSLENRFKEEVLLIDRNNELSEEQRNQFERQNCQEILLSDHFKIEKTYPDSLDELYTKVWNQYQNQIKHLVGLELYAIMPVAMFRGLCHVLSENFKKNVEKNTDEKLTDFGRMKGCWFTDEHLKIWNKTFEKHSIQQLKIALFNDVRSETLQAFIDIISKCDDQKTKICVVLVHHSHLGWRYSHEEKTRELFLQYQLAMQAKNFIWLLTPVQ